MGNAASSRRTSGPYPLIVDAEGEEGKILAGRPLPSPRPELVLYEHKHLERGVQNRINESLHKQGYRLATSIGHGAKPGDLLYARAAGPYAGGACQATGPTGPDRPIVYEISAHTNVT